MTSGCQTDAMGEEVGSRGRAGVGNAASVRAGEVRAKAGEEGLRSWLFPQVVNGELRTKYYGASGFRKRRCFHKGDGGQEEGMSEQDVKRLYDAETPAEAANLRFQGGRGRSLRDGVLEADGALAGRGGEARPPGRKGRRSRQRPTGCGGGPGWITDSGGREEQGLCGVAGGEGEVREG